MSGLIALVFAGGFGTAVMAMLNASGDRTPAPIVIDDTYADVDRILDAPYTPSCLWWEAMQ